MTTIQALILAAGMSNRFGTELNKLITPLCGRPLVMHSIHMLEELNVPVTVIVGHQKELVMNTINTCATSSITYAIQQEQRGTGHAVMCSKESWQAEHILILNGDMPLVSAAIIKALCEQHITRDATISFIVAQPDTPHHAYGRVINDENGIRIIEAKDFTGDKTQPYPINAGIYLFKRAFLENALATLTPDNASKELYLTDLIARASEQKLTVCTLNVPFDYVRGINTREEWCIAQDIKRRYIVQKWMQRGIRIAMPHTVHIDDTVTIKRNTFIHAGVHLLGATTIGTDCTIEPYSIIENSIIDDNSIIHSHSCINDSRVDHHADIGPFARLRNEVHVAPYAEVGNFVEVKKSNIGTESKAKHLSYLGDSIIGSNVNIGAGTITCNYDGIHKHQTMIKDNAFIGSNNTLIAPLTIGEGAFTAAGSTITHDVPADALAIGRARQINKDEYAHKLRQEKLPQMNNVQRTHSAE